MNKVKSRVGVGFATAELLPDDDNTFRIAHDDWRAYGMRKAGLARLSPACRRLIGYLLGRSPISLYEVLQCPCFLLD